MEINGRKRRRNDYWPDDTFQTLSFYRLFPATKSTHHILEGALPHRITLVKSGGVCRLKRARVVLVFSTVLYNHDDDDQDERDDRRGEGEDQQLSPPRKGLGRLRRGRSVLLQISQLFVQQNACRRRPPGLLLRPPPPRSPNLSSVSLSRIVRISSPKPMSSMRSASSRTT